MGVGVSTLYVISRTRQKILRTTALDRLQDNLIITINSTVILIILMELPVQYFI